MMFITGSLDCGGVQSFDCPDIETAKKELIEWAKKNKLSENERWFHLETLRPLFPPNFSQP